MIPSEPLQPDDPPVRSEEPLPAGATVEDVEITRFIEFSSFGVVYLARHASDPTPLLLEEYLPAGIAARSAEGLVGPREPAQQMAFERGLQSFIGEALALAQFEHPHILRVLSVWEAQGTAYRTRPQESGTTLLAKRLGAAAPLDEAALRALLKGMLAALEALNQAGLTHGHIAPADVLMLDDGRAMLPDFDAVRCALASDMAQPFVDAYADTAKQQQTARADLHAVAALMHFAISAQWPPASATEGAACEPLATVLARLQQQHLAVPTYGPEFLRAIDMALAPAAPPASVAALRALFEAKAAPEALAAAAPPRRKAARDSRPSVPNYARSGYPLGSSASVLEMLAAFERRPQYPDTDIEPFQSPSLPTLTEEAEPALPPLRENPFETMEATDPPQRFTAGAAHFVAEALAKPAVRRWRAVAWGLAIALPLVLALLAWQLRG